MTREGWVRTLGSRRPASFREKWPPLATPAPPAMLAAWTPGPRRRRGAGRLGAPARHRGQDKAEDEPDDADDQENLSNHLNVDRADLAKVDGVGDDRAKRDQE